MISVRTDAPAMHLFTGAGGRGLIRMCLSFRYFSLTSVFLITLMAYGLYYIDFCRNAFQTQNLFSFDLNEVVL